MAKKEKASVWQILKEGLSPPGSALYAGSHLHISDRGSLQVENCRGVVEYEESVILLQLDRCRVRISGDGLFLRELDKTGAQVEGLVLRVDLIYE